MQAATRHAARHGTKERNGTRNPNYQPPTANYLTTNYLTTNYLTINYQLDRESSEDLAAEHTALPGIRRVRAHRVRSVRRHRLA